MTQISPSAALRGLNDIPYRPAPRALLSELIWLTEGRICALSVRRYVPLVVNQTRVANLPRRQTRKTGQMLPYNQDRL